MSVLWTILQVLLAIAVAVVLYAIGARYIRMFHEIEPPPDEPELQELQDVDYRYRCIVCGAEAVVYAAPNGELPEPPRHCREDMALVPPVQ